MLGDAVPERPNIHDLLNPISSVRELAPKPRRWVWPLSLSADLTTEHRTRKWNLNANLERQTSTPNPGADPATNNVPSATAYVSAWTNPLPSRIWVESPSVTGSCYILESLDMSGIWNLIFKSWRMQFGKQLPLPLIMLASCIRHCRHDLTCRTENNLKTRLVLRVFSQRNFHS